MELEKTADVAKKKYLPMKLCFKPKVLIGNSYIHIGLPPKITPVVASKFYSTYQDDPISEEKIEKIRKELETASPKEKYEKPLTENQKYGWYNQNFSNITQEEQMEKYLDFRMKKNQFIIEHLMNYAKIRD
ncbi:uncharacterized protein LOC123680495 [Harmonia axyridis]|uniref:uncharacterized protein LOC123680495 n=1 Tax=Harmonia axyridis TaxID=115357 RepID=UPI001E2763B0|nr:uncharacterized protein LOC123680495 [Harmonia axyridis]